MSEEIINSDQACGSVPTLKQVIRLDSLPLGQTYFTPEGYLKDRPILTSIGIFEYTNPDGSIRRELRLPEDVFNADSLRSYEGKPIIITHDAGLVDKKNVHDNQIGTILSEGYQSGNDVRAKIIIHDTDEMKECGLKELSLGYNLDLEETPGEWNGQHYDAIQRNIRINHLALVREARAGEQARLNIDGRDSEKLEGGKPMKKPTPKKTRRADGALTPEELETAIAQYKAMRAKDETAADAEEEEVLAEEAKAETLPMKEEKVDAEEEEMNEEKVEDVVIPDEDENLEEKVEELKEKHAEDADDDIQLLFNIIDTLLAQKAFENQDEEMAVEENADECGNDETAADCGVMKKNADEDEDPVPTTNEEEVGKILNADSIDAIVRQRIQVGMVGRKVNLDGLENMKLLDAKKAIILAVRPGMRLDGKSETYINAAYNMSVSDINSRTEKNVSYQKRQMFNKETKRADSTDTTNSASNRRQEMIKRHQNKEDK